MQAQLCCLRVSGACHETGQGGGFGIDGNVRHWAALREMRMADNGWQAEIPLDRSYSLRALKSMKQTDQIAIISAPCRAYLDLLNSAPADPRERQLKLATTLDRLCVAFNTTHDIELDADNVDAPRVDPKQFGEKAASAFPELGFYPDADPLDGFDQEIGQGWGLDDLMDIAVDLTEVLWLIDQHQDDEAIWQFRWGYENHWGHHLHDLRRYLHKLLYWG
ncbi:hypothetical protein GCM10010833_17580 [Blastomonas aquatica]|uniref:DUF5063 domain-containing protein n=1 Tax=Blastomonas aquatica TaxID=1510276 RepID=A0ABQ1JB65_9SPHN|nr:hypothetical protein GCM10010833_17580 [Blastomonas aquatica]